MVFGVHNSNVSILYALKQFKNRLLHVGFFPNNENAHGRLCKLLQDNFR